MDRRTSGCNSLTGAFRTGVLGLAAGALVLLLGSPARAGNEFENGFEDQLGRIAAYELVHLGKYLLHDLYGQPYSHAQQRRRHDRRHHFPRPRHRHERQYYGHRHGRWHELRHFERGADCNAEYERIVRVSPGGGAVTVYERGYGYDDVHRHRHARGSYSWYTRYGRR